MSRSNGQHGPSSPSSGRSPGSASPGPSLSLGPEETKPRTAPLSKEIIDTYGPFRVLRDEGGYLFEVDGGPRALSLEEVAKLRAIVRRVYERERERVRREKEGNRWECADHEPYRRPGQS